jgi:hypothetical protein
MAPGKQEGAVVLELEEELPPLLVAPSAASGGKPTLWDAGDGALPLPPWARTGSFPLAARAEDEEEPGKEQGGATHRSSERTVQAPRRRQGKKGESPDPGLGRE